MNYKKIKLFSVILLTVFTSFLVYLVVFLKFGLNEIQSLFSIAGSLSIGVALLTYFYKKKQDELFATIDQITFFREKIILEWDEVQRYIKERNPGFISSRISLQNQTIDFIRKEFSVNFNRQLAIFFDAEKNYPDIWMDGTVLDKHILFLNMLEEFSLKVIYSKTDENPAFESIHNTFVEIVEKNAVALLFMREVKAGNQIYSTILSLYKSWQKKTDKVSFIKNLESFGFITKKQKETLYNKRKEKFGF
ncbi:MAG: hypothetical protein WC724_00155 [Candidatus Paceibacterota bacterium]|jgi:hypothetical protein